MLIEFYVNIPPFSIDWFTDNKDGAPLRVTTSKNLSRINGLIEDESVTNATNGGL